MSRSIPPMGPMTAGQMLSKARSDFERMKSNLSDHTIFDFFVTAWSVADYLPDSPQGNNDTLKKLLLTDRDFKVCRYLANRLKHKQVDRGKPLKEEVEFEPGAVPGRMMLGRRSSRLGAPPRHVWIIDGDEVRPIELGQRIITKWEQFLSKNGITF